MTSRYHIHDSSQIETTTCIHNMIQSKAKYIKVQKHSENRTLMITIPFAFAQFIPIQKGDTVKMTLEDKRITIEKA